jgi:hypothetical protein
MKITIENYNFKVGGELPNDSDIKEVVLMLKALLYGSGFSMYEITQHIKEE